MKSIIKKLAVLLALAAGLCVSAPAFAAVPSSSVSSYQIGPSTGTGTYVLVVAGSGWLYDVHLTSGTVGDYAVCYDSASVTGYSGVAFAGTTTAPLLADVFVSSVPVSGVTGPFSPIDSSGGRIPTVGYGNGIVCVKNNSDWANIYYRPVTQ